MATNNNNSNGSVNGSINYSSPGNRNMGVSGSLQNRQAGYELQQRFYREDSGYLDNSLSQIQEILKYYDKISEKTDKLSKTEQNRFKREREALENQIKQLEYVKDTREIDHKEAIKLIKESNRLAITGAEHYQSIMRDTQDKMSKADEARLKNVLNIKDVSEKINEDISNISKTLNNTSADFGKSLSNTFKTAGDAIANVSNMLNLSSIANNAAEQNLRSRLNIQNSVMKQFGMYSNSQYNRFRDSAKTTLGRMTLESGGLYGVEDMYKYFESLNELGITNQQIAQDQLQASITGNKYLGVSTETQALIFKFMRTTNSYDMLDKHNKTIAGLLKSQLGVSKEQLDVMSKSIYSDADVLSAVGANASQYTRTALAAGTVVDSISGTSGWGDTLTKTLGQLVTSAPSELGKWAQVFGSDVTTIRQLGLQGRSDEAIRRMISNDFLANLSNNSPDFILEAMHQLGIDSTLININKYFSGNGKMSEYDSSVVESLKNIENMTDEELNQYIQNTSELTALEKIENFTSFATDIFKSWNGVFNLANIALSMYIASGITKVIGGISKFIGGWGNGGGIQGGLSALIGSQISPALSKILGGGIVVGLTATAIAGLSAAVSAAFDNKRNISEDQFSSTQASLKSSGNALAGNEAYVRTTASSTNLSKTGFLESVGGKMANSTSAWANVFNKGDPVKYNEEVWKNFEKSNSAALRNKPGVIQAMQYMYAILLNEANTPSVAQSLFGISKQDIKEYINKEPNSVNKLKTALNNYNKLTSGFNDMYGMVWPIDFSGKSHNSFSIDGYKKAGLAFVPKDNYRALLHKGEMVLNEREANRYRAERNVGGQSDTLYGSQQKIVLGSLIPSSSSVTYAGAQMGLPAGWSVSSGYGTYTGITDSTGKIKIHRGIDFAAASGTPIRAANGGILYFGNAGGFGNSVKIATDSGLYNRYGHLSRFASGLKNGMRIARGQLIGYVGSTGNSTGPHLHFQVNKSDNDRDDINPWPYVMMEMFGGAGGLGLSDISSGLSTSTTSVPKATTARFINGMFTADKNVGGADRVVNSVDGGFNRLIAYLDNISKRQDEQQILLESFSRSRASGKDF